MEYIGFIFCIDLRDDLWSSRIDLKMVKWDYHNLICIWKHNQMINTQWMFIYKKPCYFKVHRLSYHRSFIEYHAFLCPALISSIKELCMCTVCALKRKRVRVACHRQKTAGGCIDFRWSTNIQLVVIRNQQYLSLHSVCYFRQHFSGPFCAIIIHPVNMTKKS